MKISQSFRDLIEPFRVYLFSFKWKKSNKHNNTYPGNRFDANKVFVGNNSYGKLNVYAYNDVESGKLYIGNYCSIARTAIFLTSGNHSYTGFSTFPFEKIVFHENYNGSKGDIVVKDDVWIGENSIILSGVTIGQGAIVAAGAVVAGDIPPYSIVGGVPAKVINYRFPEEIRERLQNLDFSKLDFQFIKMHKNEISQKINAKGDLNWLSDYLRK